MKTDQIKKEIHEYLETAEERILKAVHAMLKEYNDSEYELSESDIRTLEERRAEYKSGKGKSYTPAQVRKMITAKRKK